MRPGGWDLGLGFRVIWVQGFRGLGVQVLGWVLTPPSNVLLRAIYTHIIIFIQLLLRGFRVWGLGCWGLGVGGLLAFG